MQKKPIYISMKCALLLIVSGCNLLPSKQDSELVIDSNKPIEKKVIEPPPSQQALLIKDNAGNQYKQQQILEIGSGEYIATPTRSTTVDPVEGDITLNFQGTDINEFVKAVLGDILNKNFVIDPQISGTVTMEISQPIRKDELFPLLEEILSINNAVIVKSDRLYKILPRTKAIKGNLSPGAVNKTISPGYNVKIIPLNYIAAQEMQKILEPFATKNSNIRIDTQRNMIILAGTSQELTALQETIEIFDVDWLRGMSVGLYPLNYVEPKSLKAELDAILGGTTNSSGNELLGGLVRTLPIERLNSILLISSTATALREVENWLRRLDRPGEQVGQYLYVYEVQNAKATELADILGHIFGTGTSSSTSTKTEATPAPGTLPINIANEESDTQKGIIPLSTTPSKNIKIIADDTRNALVILATQKDYRMVAAAIQKLDVVPLQVLIEASILEVTLNSNLNYGVEWFFDHKVGGNHIGQGKLDSGAAGLAAVAPGFSYTIINNASNIKVALNTLETETEVNVLSAPSLMVLDNQTATIKVGDEIPVPTRQSISNADPDAPTVNEIQFRNTGITLEVTPRVNNSGLVTMDIRQEVSNAITTTTSSIDAPTIQQRQIESKVAINTGETIVLGGLIRNSETDAKGGILGLHKIPLLGKLFGNTNIKKRRTELIVLLTPRVVRNNNDARNITNEFRQKLKNLLPAKIKH